MTDQVSPTRSPTAGGLRRAASLALILVLIVGGLFWIQGGDPVANVRALTSGDGLAALLGQAPAPRPGRFAPDFTLADLNGNLVTLSELRGKKVVLNFWATWCPPCRAEMPDLDRLSRDHADRVTVLLIDIEEGEPQIRPFLEDIGVVLVPLLDVDAEVATNYRVAALPTSVIIDKDGVVEEIQVGAVTYEWFAARLD